ncbi:DNA internalization-related competence protein ComEC/Rec2 [Halomonas koreensis]|uniref:DNA internalization-related competence protein ComEC/Rec2 n=1 Tax=Halomonas koreensis TaxID=245385 RepID=A0ABU1G5Q5_9GAMM|nr:DNA internalization-related competence protein ComEC/Rec2 [Halomonas koreensis]MDR5868270.1 DNA internalization-related competence protein ComEC/Rec2 [Halomonas koreensis]
MRTGLAMPLALAVLGGALAGHLGAGASAQGLGLALLVALGGRRWRAGLLLLVALGVAGQLWLARGGELSPGLSRQELILEGRLAAVTRRDGLQRLVIDVETCRPGSPGLPDCDDLSRARLGAYDAPPMRPGERWRLAARLRPPSGFANPGAFDYRAWLRREGIQATGYVRRAPAPRRLSAAPFSLRRRALAHLDTRALPPTATRWLAALTLGADERLTADDWERLNASGTTHLMVISGLHVGLVAGFTLALARGLARCLTPGGWRMAVWPWWIAGIATLGYALLAGLEPPAFRATIMALVGLWVASGRHAPGPWQAWWLALALVVGLDPLAAWRPGTWLSFGAVALLILIWQGRPRPRGVRGWLWALARSQLLLAPVMAGGVLLAFDRLALAAPLVNLVAVPLVGSLLVPLGLAGWALAWLPGVSDGLWRGFALLTQGLLDGLAAAVAVLPLWEPPAPLAMPLGVALILAGLLWALPGLARSLRLAGSGLLACLLLWPPVEAPPPGALRVRVHDVGQGQLVALRTARHRVLVDTGPRFASGFMPLATLWPDGQRFDDVIVSHGDLDHAGGLAALAASHRVGRYLAPPGAELPVAAEPCVTGRRWRRDGVRFRVLWPPEGTAGLSDNDRSCVLLVSAGEHRLLITGDAGRRVERTLLASLDGPVSVLIAGHHGSRSSSDPAFLAAVRPRQVVVSAARDNRYGHPAPAVVRRFRALGSCLWSTARDGAVTLWLGRGQGLRASAERRGAGGRGGVEGGCLAVESPPVDAGLSPVKARGR